MIKEKLTKFKVSIRNQQKERKFAEMRQEYHQQKEVEDLINKLFQLQVSTSNYQNFQQLFHHLNEYLIVFSKTSSKSDLLELRKLTYSEEGELYGYNPLKKQSRKLGNLCSEQFKELLLKLFELITFQKFIPQHSQLRQQLQYQLFFLVGMLFKEPTALTYYFPLQGIDEYIETENYSLQKKQQEIYSSFQLLDYSLQYLKENFTSILNLLGERQILFLTIVHTLKTVISFFVTNSKTLKGKNEYRNLNKDFNKKNSSTNDNQVIDQLYQVIKSHNLPKYLGQLIDAFFSKGNLIQIQGNKDVRNEISVMVAVCSFMESYLSLIESVDGLYIPIFLQGLVVRFGENCLQQVKKWYGSETLYIRQMNEGQGLSLKERTIGKVYLKSLFSLSLLFSHTQIAYPQKIVIDLCVQIIKYLNYHQSSWRQGNFNEDNFASDHNKQSNNIYSTKACQFYFSVLVAEQDDKWIHQLQLLGCLEELTREYGITLDQILNHSIRVNENQEQTQKGINEKQLFEFICNAAFKITNISGYFYNQRHLFMVTLVNLYLNWAESSHQNSESSFSHEFWLQLMSNLHKSIQQLKSSIKNDQSLRQISFSGRETQIKYNQFHQIKQKSINLNQMNPLQCLNRLEDNLLQITQSFLQNSNQIIEI